MSHQEYVQLEAVRTALEQFVKDENAIEEVLKLLGASTLSVDETETPEATDSVSEKEESDVP